MGGNSKPDCNIACKGHLPVKDLMKFIFDEEKKSEERKKAKSPDSILYNRRTSESASGPASVEESSSQEDMSEEEEEMSESEEEKLVEKVIKENGSRLKALVEKTIEETVTITIMPITQTTGRKHQGKEQLQCQEQEPERHQRAKGFPS